MQLSNEYWLVRSVFTSYFVPRFVKVNVEDESSKIAFESLGTIIELEASNCSLSLQDACACLLPIMQLVVAKMQPQIDQSSSK